jgi:anaerobic selenocysteine-containing dehydrogenase
MPKTACPLDCYDACSILYEEGKLKGDTDHPLTKGYLCPSLNGFLKTPRIQTPRYQNKEISLQEAMRILTSLLENNRENTLLYTGSGNVGKMQSITSEFFAPFGATFTRGSLCDGAGDAGIVSGRGANLLMPISQIKKSEVVVIWGRNLTVTNAHMQEIVKDKITIVIDPVKTKIARQADIHIQLKPRSDFSLTLLWARIAYLEEMQDDDFIDDHTEGYEDFVDFFRGYTIKQLMKEIDCSVNDAMAALKLMSTHKTTFLVGVGVQKYLHGDGVLKAIDSFAAMLGLFGKEGCGVSYLSNSGYAFDSPFSKPSKSIPKPTVDFSKFTLTFVQGGNPLAQLPNSERVKKSFEKTTGIYFGLFENETSMACDLVIPAQSFLEKEDLRLSYGSEYVSQMPKLTEPTIGISEYKLTQFLCQTFGLEALDEEGEYINQIIASNTTKKDSGYLIAATYRDIPYAHGFYTVDEKFLFMDEIEDEDYLDEEEGYFLITSKARHSINSQFKRDSYLYVHSSSGFDDGDMVEASSETGSAVFEVRLDESLRGDSILIHSGAPNVNSITPSILSNEGECAVYQEVKITLKRKK